MMLPFSRPGFLQLLDFAGLFCFLKPELTKQNGVLGLVGWSTAKINSEAPKRADLHRIPGAGATFRGGAAGVPWEQGLWGAQSRFLIEASSL